MKKIVFLFFLLAPMLANSQCKSFIACSPDSAMWLLPTVQSIFGQELRRSDNPFDKENITYRDSLDYINLSILSEREYRYQGINKIDMGLKVNRIIVKGPEDLAIVFFDYLKSKLSKCEGFKSGGQWIMALGIRVYWQSEYSEKEIPLRKIFIEKDK